MDTLTVFTTCPDVDVATELARHLIQQKLAACVNVIPTMHAIYRWQDAIEESKEALLLIKTTQERYAALEEYIAKQHPYQIPEIIAVPIVRCSNASLQWMIESCTPENNQ